jgi:hypothetical protein
VIIAARVRDRIFFEGLIKALSMKTSHYAVDIVVVSPFEIEGGQAVCSVIRKTRFGFRETS